MKAKSLPTNLFDNFYQSLSAIRAAERRLAEANVMPQDLREYGLAYMDINVCPACSEIIDSPTRAYRDPFSEVLLCNKSCWEDWGMMQ